MGGVGIWNHERRVGEITVLRLAGDRDSLLASNGRTHPRSTD